MRSSALRRAVAGHLRADDPVRFGVVGDDPYIKVVLVAKQRDFGTLGRRVARYRAAAGSSRRSSVPLLQIGSLSVPSIVIGT